MLERRLDSISFHSRSQLGEDRVGADNIKLICEKRWIGAKIGIGKALYFVSDTVLDTATMYLSPT